MRFDQLCARLPVPESRGERLLVPPPDLTDLEQTIVATFDLPLVAEASFGALALLRA